MATKGRVGGASECFRNGTREEGKKEGIARVGSVARATVARWKGFARKGFANGAVVALKLLQRGVGFRNPTAATTTGGASKGGGDLPWRRSHELGARERNREGEGNKAEGT